MEAQSRGGGGGVEKRNQAKYIYLSFLETE